MTAFRTSLTVIALLLAPMSMRAAERLIVCGGPEVFIIPADVKQVADKDRLWRWRAADSRELPAEMHAQFRTTDECKPVGDAILITASSGGVALIRREDKKCLYYTSAKNAHSACLVPKERLAVASSHGGDEVLLFDRKRSGAEVAPLARLAFDGAHGVLWDAERDRLWALGTKELVLIEVRSPAQGGVELTVDKKWPLPTSGGHDLFPMRDSRYLFVTTNTHVYRYDTKEGRFEPLPKLAEQPKVKSIDQHPRTGQIVYHQGTDKTWWSDTIRFLEPERTLQLPDEKLYKVRWDVDRDQPK
jgi:hypothetical protein